MKLKDRQQQLHMDLHVGGFVIEKRYRDASDLVNICQRYAGAVRQGTQIKK